MRDPRLTPQGAGGPTMEECLQYLRRANLPNIWATALPALMKPLSLPLVQAVLADMPPNSAPGADGIPASLYIHFSKHFAPQMLGILNSIFFWGEIPQEWLLGIVRVVPKVPGGIAPDQQLLICLQVVALKWMSAIILA